MADKKLKKKKEPPTLDEVNAVVKAANVHKIVKKKQDAVKNK